MIYKTGIGQDSHRFESADSSKPCILGGVHIKDTPGFIANSDGDVIYHALCNAISSVTGTLILGGIADDLCEKDGITDSSAYLLEAKKTLGSHQIVHIALSVEAKRPILKPYLNEIRENIAKLLGLKVSQVGITATTGEGLTDFGCGDGVQCFAMITFSSTIESI